MNIGDYVRTKKGITKIIGRVSDPTNYYDKFWICDRYLELNDETEYIHEQDIIGEPKKNIIDLIEVGDIVNYEQLNGGVVLNKKEDSIDTWSILPNSLKNEDIKSVITREQLKTMQYKVESEVN